MSDVDKRRGMYYKYYTGRDWADARNYDVCLDSGKIGYRGCVEAIKQQIELRFGGKYVSRSEMLPGDVVCYSGHVAIYIGGGKIVHASNSRPYPAGGIKISDNYAYRTVLAVRRYW